jgi:hypothetical protein
MGALDAKTRATNGTTVDLVTKTVKRKKHRAELPFSEWSEGVAES